MTTPTAGSNGSVEIRVLTPADASAYRSLRLAALREQPPAFSATPEEEEQRSIDDFAAWLKATADMWALGAFCDGRLVGIARFTRHDRPSQRHKAYVNSVFVAPGYRGRGCARQMMQTIIHQSRSLTGLRRLILGVVVDNTAAIALYESLGFRRYGTEPEAFIRDGVAYAEHLMTLDL